jgi:membrane protease subunit (stomatin/prohibitin family)
MGISVEGLFIENVSLPQEVEQAIDKRTSVGVMSDKMQSFMQYQTAEAIRDAAKNEGGVAGAGVGLGAGLGMGQMFAEAMKNVKDEPKPTEDTKVSCNNCGKAIPANVKFCPECGGKLPEKRFCVKCGKPMPASANFCPECGTKVEN